MTTATIARPRARVRPGARMTLDEFIELLPDTEQRCELHRGVLYLMPEASVDHQFLTQMLWQYLFDALTAAGIAYAYTPVNQVLSDDTYVTPDIIVVRAGREGIIGPVRVYGATDIVVETFSSDRERDLVTKRRQYQASGIPEYWLLDGGADTLTVLALGPDGRYRERAVLTTADTLTTPLFPQFRLPLAQLFGHPARLRR